jgi:hypothetical protein
LKWRVTRGHLPPGIGLLPSGTLTGTPTSPQVEPFKFVLEVSDSSQPPQRVAQQFALAVAAGQLRILPGILARLKIVPPPQDQPVAPDPPDQPVALASDPPAVNVPGLAAAVPAATQQTLAFADPPSAQSAPTAAAPKKSERTRKATSEKAGFDPATFIRIYEDTKAGGHIEIHNPKSRHDAGSHLSVDAESSVVIVPDSTLLKNSDLSLNKLFMSAVLSSEDKQQNLEVVGYSEVGKDKASTEAQRGMAFQTSENIQNMVLNMASTSVDIIKYVYEVGDDKSIYDADVQTRVKSPVKDAAQKQRAKDRFALYRPEIQAIGDFFSNEQNLSLVRIMGKEIFWIDSASLEEIAKQYKENVRIAFDPSSKDSAVDDALTQLLERTKLVVADFRDLVLEIKKTENETCPANEAQLPPDKQPCSCADQKVNAGLTKADQDHLKRTCAIEKVANEMRSNAFRELAKLFAPGSISLRSAKAADGNLLTVTVEAVGADGSPVGIPAVFEIDIKKYGAKIQWSPSLLFVRRLGVTDAEAAPPAGSTAPPINKVNFAPSPGMTFGIAYFKRGNSKGDKFLRALGPGAGMNVTFMNFNDPSFDLSTQKFVNTSGTNVQVGAGLIGSLFDNKIQFSYGWNLNVENRRRYFGVGFGFIEIGKELTKYIPK